MDASAENHTLASEPVESIAVIAQHAFRGWEKLRLIYNAVLAILVVLFVRVLSGSWSGDAAAWRMIVKGAVIANVCFFVGPVTETYLKWLGFRSDHFRGIAFAIGTLFASLLAVAALSTHFLTGFD